MIKDYEEKQEMNDGITLAKIIGLLFVVVLLAVIILIFSCSKARAEEWTDAQIVEAIYKAEGGSKAKYLYGIRSVHYATAKEARKICFNTVRNNRKRYNKDARRSSMDFISFLGSRYCPVKGGIFTASEKRLNKHWIKNVMYFLKKGA